MNTATPLNVDYFDALFRNDPDPWHFKSRWYEKRKRALTLACLPADRYLSGFEPGCANGELAAALATRCDRLLCSDGSALAVQAARERLRATPNAEVRRLWLPDEWPEDAFDLIVISELAYYLNAAQLDELMRCVMRTLTSHGTVVACHWRHHIAGCALRGDDVHDALVKGLPLARLSAHVEADFRLDLWSRDARSVAQREGLL
jgi:SAM-dependent methyltransferase